MLRNTPKTSYYTGMNSKKFLASITGYIPQSGNGLSSIFDGEISYDQRIRFLNQQDFI